MLRGRQRLHRGVSQGLHRVSSPQRARTGESEWRRRRRRTMLKIHETLNPLVAITTLPAAILDRPATMTRLFFFSG